MSAWPKVSWSWSCKWAGTRRQAGKWGRMRFADANCVVDVDTALWDSPNVLAAATDPYVLSLQIESGRCRARHRRSFLSLAMTGNVW